MPGAGRELLDAGGNVVLTACGTSLLTNAADQAFRSKLFQHSNQQEGDMPEDVRHELEALGKQEAERLGEMGPPRSRLDVRGTRNARANLWGRLDHPGWPAGRAHPASHRHLRRPSRRECPLRGWLDLQGFTARLKTFTGLQLRDLTAFHRSTSEMARWCREVIGPRQGTGQGKVVFNLTGGFKAVMGFLVPLGMFYADRIIYGFEGEDDLVSIPRLPMQIDPEAELVTHPAVFRRLSAGLPVKEDDLADVAETLLDRTGSQPTLSAWGEIAWGDYVEEYYEEELLEPLIDKIVLTDKFEKGADKLQSDKLARLNEQMDKLAGYMESGGEHNLASLRFHGLEGKPKGKSTYEFYAGSGSDATRVYGHFEDDGNVFVIDEIGGHL